MATRPIGSWPLQILDGCCSSIPALALRTSSARRNFANGWPPRANRPPRLIYAGRYHSMKGTLDVIKVGIELDRLGVDFQLDLYGKGPLRDQMESLVSETQSRRKN